MKARRPVEILLVEDNPGDVVLTKEAFRDFKLANRLTVAGDGVEAMNILRRGAADDGAFRPDLILLDLNMPRMDGTAVLAQIKVDPKLDVIPVVVLTSSAADEDIITSYRLKANCYITKPVDFSQFIRVIQSIEDFWFNVVKLPPR